MRALNTRDFAKQLPAVFIHHHHAILAADEQAVIGRIGHDVIPASFPT